MEARFFSAALIAVSLLSLGASYRTQNFVVTAPTPEVAQALGQAGETYRRDLALDWLGRELPPWQDRCPITVHVGQHLGAGGATSFVFDNGRPFGWQMTIQGSYERLLDSVLPHEITHMIFATHFGRPLPRWADEGAATSVEHASEKAKQHHLLINFLTTGRGIAFNHLFAMQEYPQDILPLYSQGFSLARFLISQSGRREFVEYIGDGMEWNNWTAATKKHYGYRSLSELQVAWLEWVRQGSPPLQPRSPLLAQQDPAQGAPMAGMQVAPAVFTAPGPVPVIDASLSAASGGGSWYARQRDLAAASRPARSNAGTTVAVPAATTTAPAAAEPLISSSLARPQEPGTPQPTVIQWQSSPPAASAAVPLTWPQTRSSTAAPPLVPLPVPSYY